jgi:Flp pilus assembly protein TadG
MLRTARRMGRQERGQALVLVTLAMTVTLAMGAMSIDVSGWYQKHHETQVSADSAALAAANCLADSGSTGDTCTSTTDTADASNVATAIASDNAATISGITYGSGSVTVTTQATAPTAFAGLLGLAHRQVAARSVASYDMGSDGCTSSLQTSGGCYSIFAGGPNAITCSDSTISLGGGGDTFSGGVHANGNITGTSDGGDDFEGPVSWGTGCTGATGATYGSTDVGEAPVTTWPMNFATVLPACSATGQYQCTGPDETPSYCGNNTTMTNTNVTVPTTVPGADIGIWCAYGTGTGVNPDNPATWTGTITLTGGSSSTTESTYIGGSASFSNGTSSTFEAYECTTTTSGCTYPLFYLLGNGTTTNFGNGGYTFIGALFAPNGTIAFGGGGNSATFLEGESVSDAGGGFTGDGPSATGSSTSQGTDSLSQ